MIDRRQIVELYARGDAVALVTLVRVEGSSYRRVGARLLIAANGDYAGSISGGCLEAEVIRKARWLTRDGATMQRYSTLFDDTADIPFGLGCGGTVDLLIEPAQTAECAALMGAMQSALEGRPQQVCTALPTLAGRFARTVTPLNVSPSSRTDPFAAAENGNTIREQFLPPQRLFILGAGDDARPMAECPTRWGGRGSAPHSRPQWARPERVPGATVLIEPTSAALVAQVSCRIDPADAVVLMTHSYEQDRDWLRAVLPLEPCYLGLLGARHRSALLVAEAAAMLGWDVARACEGLFAPVGLDLGGDGPEAIALATIAEIQARVEGKLGASRRLTAELVEQQIAAGGASRYLQTQCAL